MLMNLTTIMFINLLLHPSCAPTAEIRFAAADGCIRVQCAAKCTRALPDASLFWGCFLFIFRCFLFVLHCSKPGVDSVLFIPRPFGWIAVDPVTGCNALTYANLYDPKKQKKKTHPVCAVRMPLLIFRF